MISKKTGCFGALMVSLAMLTSACAYHKSKDGAEGSNPPAAANANGGGPNAGAAGTVAIPGYATIRQQVFAPLCIKCHGSRGGVSLETYASAVSFADQIRNEALVEKSMPPSGPLGASEQALLKQWLDNGMPENDVTASAAAPSAPASAPTLAPAASSFDPVRKAIFEAHCTGCHDGSFAFGLQTYDEVKARVSSIQSEALVKKEMPPADSGDSLSDAELAMLKAWIDQGAKQ